MNNKILTTISTCKKRYEDEGFLISGIFGSYARGEERPDSDIDVTYKLSNDFINRYNGWDIFQRIDDIRNEIESALGTKIDLANENALDKTSRHFIFKEFISVA